MEPLEHDPFATKGVEYLIVLAFLALLPFYSRYLNGRPSAAPSRVLAALRRFAGRWIRLPEVAILRPGWTQYLGGPHRSARRTGSSAAAPALSGWFKLPETAYYHPGHTWAVPAGPGRVRVGVDDFAHKVLGAARAISLPEVGATLAKDGPGCALVIEGQRFELPAPVAGRVTARNEAVALDPRAGIEDPYEGGWLLEVEVPKLKRSLRNLLHGDRAREWLARAEEALRLRMSPEVGAVLQDGGVPVPGIARALSSENWDQLARELLSRG